MCVYTSVRDKYKVKELVKRAVATLPKADFELDPSFAVIKKNTVSR